MFTHRSKLVSDEHKQFVLHQLVKFHKNNNQTDLLGILGDYLLDIGDQRCDILHWLYNDNQHMILMDQIYNFRKWKTNTQKSSIHHSSKWKELIKFCRTDQIYIGLPINSTGRPIEQMMPRISINVHKNNLGQVGCYTLIEKKWWARELSVWFPEI